MIEVNRKEFTVISMNNKIQLSVYQPKLTNYNQPQ